MKDFDYFWQLEMMARRSIRMYGLTKNERRICDVIVDHSFARQRESVMIRELDFFVKLTGIDRADVSKTLQRLDDKGIVQKNGPAWARVYAFIPAASFWTDRPPVIDVEAAIAVERLIESDNELSSAGCEPTGQGKLPLPADAPGLKEGIAMAARDEAIGDSPIGKTPTTRGVGDSPICENAQPLKVRASGRTHDVLQYVSTQNVQQYVTDGDSPTTAIAAEEERRKSFADPDKNYAFELLENLSSKTPRDRDDFTRNRWNWVRRVKMTDANIIIRAAGIVKEQEQQPRNKRDKPIGAVLFKECQKIASMLGKTFHLW